MEREKGKMSQRKKKKKRKKKRKRKRKRRKRKRRRERKRIVMRKKMSSVFVLNAELLRPLDGGLVLRGPKLFVILVVCDIIKQEGKERGKMGRRS